RKAVDFIQMSHDEALLIGRQCQLLQPSSTLLGEEIARLAWDEIRMKDRLNAILQSRHLRHELNSLGDTSPPKFNLFCGHPNFGQEACCMQPSKSCGVDLVGLDLGPCDGTHLQRVCDRHRSNERRQQSND